MKKSKGWSVDDTTKFFIDERLSEDQNKKDSEIVKFRTRWKLGKKGLKNPKAFPRWQKKVIRECHDYCRKIKLSELEFYFNLAEGDQKYTIPSSLLEDRTRELNFGDSLTVLFAYEALVLGRNIKIPAEYQSFFENYLLYNTKDYSLIFNHGITVSHRFRFDEENGIITENVCLILGENSISGDLDNFWEEKLKPYLINLNGRIHDIQRVGKSTYLITKMKRHKEKDGGWSSAYFDYATDKKIRVGDRELITDSLSEKELGKLYSSSSSKNEQKKNRNINRSLARKVYNSRYYRFKKKLLR